MKKLVCLFSAALLVLAGCSDAATKVSDGKDALATIGKTTITKQDIYEGLLSRVASSEIINRATSFICEKEVPITDEITENAKKTMEQFKTYVGEDKWNDFITSMGYENEEAYFNDRVLVSAQAEVIPTKYIDEQFDTLKEKYQPRKVEILQTSDGSTAAAAQEEAAAGASIKDLVEKYKDKVSTTTFKGEPQVITNQSLPESVWENIVKVTEDNTLVTPYQYKADLSTFYVIKVTQVDVEQEEAKEAIASVKTITDDAYAYFLNKYNFRVYDIDLYTSIKAQKPSYLVQDAE